MNTIPKEHFVKMLKYRPQSLIGKMIIYKKHTRQICDISLCGDSILMSEYNIGTEISIKDWYPLGEIDDPVIIDIRPDDIYDNWEAGKGCTVSSVMFWKKFEEQERIKKLEVENNALRKEVADAIQTATQAKATEKMQSALKAAQSYLLTLPGGTDKQGKKERICEILYQIDEGIKNPEKMPDALSNIYYYLLKYAGEHKINNIEDPRPRAQGMAAVLDQVSRAMDDNRMMMDRNGLSSRFAHVVKYRIELIESSMDSLFVELPQTAHILEMNYGIKTVSGEITVIGSVDRLQAYLLLKDAYQKGNKVTDPLYPSPVLVGTIIRLFKVLVPEEQCQK